MTPSGKHSVPDVCMCVCVFSHYGFLSLCRDAMSIPAQASNAWGRHLARNSSVLADLFQGQMMSEVGSWRH